MKPVDLDLEIYKGEDFQISFALKNPDGSLIDLSGYAVVSCFRHKQEVDPKITLQTSINVATATITIEMLSSVSNTLKLGAGIYDVVLIDSYGKSEVILKGAMHVKYSPTVSETD